MLICTFSVTTYNRRDYFVVKDLLLTNEASRKKTCITNEMEQSRLLKNLFIQEGHTVYSDSKYSHSLLGMMMKQRKKKKADEQLGKSKY